MILLQFGVPSVAWDKDVSPRNGREKLITEVDLVKVAQTARKSMSARDFFDRLVYM